MYFGYWTITAAVWLQVVLKLKTTILLQPIIIQMATTLPFYLQVTTHPQASFPVHGQAMALTPIKKVTGWQ